MAFGIHTQRNRKRSGKDGTRFASTHVSLNERIFVMVYSPTRERFRICRTLFNNSEASLRV